MLWLVRRWAGTLGPRGPGQALLAALAAGLPMAGLAYGLSLLLTGVPGLAGEIVRVALPATAGAALYIWLLARLGIDDLAQIGRLAAQRFGR
jgi:hypothetical protein